MKSNKNADGIELLKVPATSKYIKKSKSWLDHGRIYGFGPPYIRIGGTVLYSRSDLDAYIAEKRVTVE